MQIWSTDAKAPGLLLLLPNRVLFGGGFGQSGVVLGNLGIVGNVTLRVAVEKIALFQAQSFAPGGESLQFCRVNRLPLLKAWRRDGLRNLFEPVMVRRSRRHWFLFKEFIVVRRARSEHEVGKNAR